MFAVQNNHVKVIQQLLSRGAHVNSRDKQGNTALMIAARDNNAMVVKILLGNRAYVNQKNKAGKLLRFYSVTELTSIKRTKQVSR